MPNIRPASVNVDERKSSFNVNIENPQQGNWQALQAQIDALRTQIASLLSIVATTGTFAPDILMESGTSQKISAMPTDGALSGSEIFPIVSGGTNQTCNTTVIANYVSEQYPGILMQSGSGVPISFMPAAAALDGTEIVPIVQAGINAQTELDNIYAFVWSGMPPIALTGPVTSVGYATTITPTGVAAGSYTNANITVNAAGQVTAATNGSSATFPSENGNRLAQSGTSILTWLNAGGQALIGVTIDVYQWTVPGVI